MRPVMKLPLLSLFLLSLLSSSSPRAKATAAGAGAAATTTTNVITAKLNAFATRFWAWRSITAPFTSDDLPRTAVVRPAGWAPNVSSAAFIQAEVDYEAFVRELGELRDGGPTGNARPFAEWDAADQADYWALTSALNRVFWELQIFTPMYSDPSYYLQQSFSAVWDVLVTTRPPKRPLWDEATVLDRLLPRLRAIPVIFKDGQINLEAGAPSRPLGQLFLQTTGNSTATSLSPLATALQASMAAVIAAADPPLTAETAEALRRGAANAGAALARFIRYVERGTYPLHRLPGHRPGGDDDNAVAAAAAAGWPTTNASVGEANYLWFLRHVSFVNFTTDELRGIGRQELSWAGTMQLLERTKNDARREPPMPPVAASLAAQVAATLNSSRHIKAFLESSGLFRFPAWFGDDAEYTAAAIPPWISPFDYSSLGEEDDFTSSRESNLGPASGASYSFVRYLPPPAPKLPFFLDSLARDARPVIVHEGIPGHWTQFRHSWRNPREARRHWLDSFANEGMAFYFEEVTTQAGLFDDIPRLRETMYEFMRLRALRVEADVGLATGHMTVEEAAEYFAVQVPMAQEEAMAEVLARLAAPAQGLSYVVGKVQLFAYLQAARAATEASKVEKVAGAGGSSNASSFDLAQFHSDVETNGNLPFVLQMHSAGLSTTLHPSFRNLHHIFEGIASDDTDDGDVSGGGSVPAAATVSSIAHDPSRISRLPGRPPGASSPVLLSGYVDIASESRSLFYLLARSSKEDSGRDSSSSSPSSASPPPLPPPPPTVPIVIWLQGGNGCSSLIGAMSENGPYRSPGGDDPGQQTTATALITNPDSLHHLAHVIYLDRPAGAGFSYSEGPPSPSWANDAQTAADSVEALELLTRRYPWLCGREVWVAGESYAGHFTAQFASALVRKEQEECGGGVNSDVNGSSSSRGCGICGVHVGGVLVGNGVVDLNQTNFAWFEAGATHSLVEESLWASMRKECDFTKDLGIDGNGCPRGVSTACATLIDRWMNETGAATNRLSLYDVYSDVCLANDDDDDDDDDDDIRSHHERGGGGGGGSSRLLRRRRRRRRRSENESPVGAPPAPVPYDACSDSHTASYLNDPLVQRAMHVRTEKLNGRPWTACSQKLNDAYSCPDTLVSVVPTYRALLEDLARRRRVLVYSGDVDNIVPTLASKRWVEDMCRHEGTAAADDDEKQQSSFRCVDSWRPWVGSDGQIGGWTKRWTTSPSGGDLVFATVRGAGHQAPSFQPRRTAELFARFLADEPLPGGQMTRTRK